MLTAKSQWDGVVPAFYGGDQPAGDTGESGVELGGSREGEMQCYEGVGLGDGS